jgi:DHA1 family tetracycline resistance protein-like MFS transporter
MVLMGVGQGLVGPSISGLLSRRTPASEQGAVLGTLTSAQTLARMISYSIANLLLGKASIVAPYWGALGIDVVALALAVRSALVFRRETTTAAVEKVKG